MQIHSYYQPFSSFLSSTSSHFIPPLIHHLPHFKPRSYHLFFKLKTKPRPHHLSLSSQFETPNETQQPQVDLLLNKPKPSPKPITPDPLPEQTPTDLPDALAPFLKFFKSRDPDSDSDPEPDSEDEYDPQEEKPNPGPDYVSGSGLDLDYYDPKAGDFAVGVVVSGNENKLDVNVGADLLGTMLTKEVMPMYEKEVEFLLCDIKDVGERLTEKKKGGRMGIVNDEEAFERERRVSGRPVVEVGTVVFAEVLGRTLSGRPLLSSRRMYRRVAWHRVRQIKQLNEPVEVKIFEWNTGGLLTRIEGLRAFLPKAELMKRANTFMDLKDNVGRQMYVSIVRIDEVANDLIISEKEAWDMMHLKEGTLLEGTVRKIFPYGAQVRIGETNRSGLLHISNITRARVTSLNDVLQVDEKVKVLVVKSLFPDKISLSIADLEREPGLFLSDKEKVFSEAEEMAKKYRQRLPVVSLTRKPDPCPIDVLPFDDEARLYSNWRWFRFEQHRDADSSNDRTNPS